MPDLGPMRRAFAFALRSVPEAERQKRDITAVALARQYADLIDQAATPNGPVAEALDLLHAAALMADAGEGDRYVKAHRRIAALVSATTVASDLGPKLMAALTALGMTPAARGGTGGGGKHDGVVGSTLALLRTSNAERSEGARKHHPAPMDAAAS